jgi:Putative Ig domain
MAIRGTGMQASSASSYTVPWPSGTVAGDLAAIVVGHGFSATIPTGWTSLDNQSGSNWNGAVFSRTLTSGDITTGSVPVNFGGTFDGCLAIATLVGSAYYLAPFFTRSSSGATIVVGTPLGTIAPALFALYFASNRAASTDTINRGTLQQTVNDGSAASGSLYAETAPAYGTTPTMSYSTAGSGYYQGTLLIASPLTVTSSGVLAPLSNAGQGSHHQVVTAPLPNFTPSHYNPVPVAAALKGGVTGSVYSETISAQGGTSPYTFAVTSGALPTGTTLNPSSGVISGTPSATGTFSFTITVTDSLGFTGSQAFNVIISAPSAGGAFTFG